MTRTRLALASGLAAAALFASAASARAAVEYSLTISQNGAVARTPLFAINDGGTPVGRLDGDPAVLVDNVFQRLPVPDDPTGTKSAGAALDINDSGTAVGYDQTETAFTAGPERPFVWQDGGVGRDLGIFPGQRVKAQGINTAGDIVGFNETRAFILRADGTLNTLPPLPNGKLSKAARANDTGLVVGQADSGTTSQPRAVSWRDGVPTDLGTLPGGVESAAVGVNDAGVAVGFSTIETATLTPATHAAMFIDGKVIDLNFPRSAFTRSDKAQAINNAGIVVGNGSAIDFSKPHVGHAIRWQNGSAVDLNTLIAPGSGFTLITANDINDAGQIVGSAVANTAINTELSYVLTPIH